MFSGRSTKVGGRLFVACVTIACVTLSLGADSPRPPTTNPSDRALVESKSRQASIDVLKNEDPRLWGPVDLPADHYSRCAKTDAILYLSGASEDAELPMPYLFSAQLSQPTNRDGKIIEPSIVIRWIATDPHAIPSFEIIGRSAEVLGRYEGRRDNRFRYQYAGTWLNTLIALPLLEGEDGKNIDDDDGRSIKIRISTKSVQEIAGIRFLSSRKPNRFVAVAQGLGVMNPRVKDVERTVDVERIEERHKKTVQGAPPPIIPED